MSNFCGLVLGWFVVFFILIGGGKTLIEKDVD
jgi:hypothetical protein